MLFASTVLGCDVPGTLSCLGMPFQAAFSDIKVDWLRPGIHILVLSENEEMDSLFNSGFPFEASLFFSEYSQSFLFFSKLRRLPN